MPLELRDPTPLIDRERLIIDQRAVDEDVAVLEHFHRRGAARLRLLTRFVARLEALQHAPEIGQQFLRELVTTRRVFLEAAGDHAVEGSGHLGIQPGHRLRRGMDNLMQHIHEGLPVERRLAGRHLVQHDTQAEGVGAVIHRTPHRLLGAHVFWGSHDLPGRGLVH